MENRYEEQLDRIRTYFEIKLDEHEFRQIKHILIEEEVWTNGLVLRVQREFFGKQINDQKTVEFTAVFPTTWWQHFKQDYFPNWLLKRFPVKKKVLKESQTVFFTRMMEFPELGTPTVQDLEPRVELNNRWLEENPHIKNKDVVVRDWNDYNKTDK